MDFCVVDNPDSTKIITKKMKRSAAPHLCLLARQVSR